jgi:uncharacterized membrane protein YczE
MHVFRGIAPWDALSVAQVSLVLLNLVGAKYYLGWMAACCWVRPGPAFDSPDPLRWFPIFFLTVVAFGAVNGTWLFVIVKRRSWYSIAAWIAIGVVWASAISLDVARHFRS